MTNFKGILTVSIPVVSVLFGILWYFGRKRPKHKEEGESVKEEKKSAVLHASRTPHCNSPLGTRKRKASQISREEDGNEDDSVEEELDCYEEKVPLMKSEESISSSPSKMENVNQKNAENSQCSIMNVTKENLQLNDNDVTSFSPVNETILVSDKSCVLNEAFVTTAISEQSILNEKDNKGKVEELSTSKIEEPLLESTMIENLNSQAQTMASQSLFSDEVSNIDDLSARLESSIELSAENYSFPLENPVSAPQTKNLQINGSSPESIPAPAVLQARSDFKQKEKVNKDSAVTNSNSKTSLNKERRKQDQGKESSPVVSSRKSHLSGGSDSFSENGLPDSNCSNDNVSESSTDSGKGKSVTEVITPTSSPSHLSYHCNFPTSECGRLIGRYGKNINIIKEKSGANISLNNNPFSPDYQLCVIEGTQKQIDVALRCISRRFPDVDLSPINLPGKESPPSTQAPVLVPEIMQVIPEMTQLNLPEGVSVDVVVSSIVDTGHLFIQQPTHPSYPSLERLNQFMNICYQQDGIVPQLPRPIEVGVICAVPLMDSWYRAQISSVYEDTDECDIKYVDYGGFSRVKGSSLRQIRSDFMTLPFQACECYLANVTPLQEEEYFSCDSSAVLEELTQGKLLQAQVVGRGEDGVPYVHIYQITGDKVLLVNRELVNRGLARWIEVLS